MLSKKHKRRRWRRNKKETKRKEDKKNRDKEGRTIQSKKRNKRKSKELKNEREKEGNARKAVPKARGHKRREWREGDFKIALILRPLNPDEIPLVFSDSRCSGGPGGHRVSVP